MTTETIFPTFADEAGFDTFSVHVEGSRIEVRSAIFGRTIATARALPGRTTGYVVTTEFGNFESDVPAEKVAETGFNLWSHARKLALRAVRKAWFDGMDVEDLADGFGAGMGTCGGDWSGIRDSSDAALGAMFDRALNG